MSTYEATIQMMQGLSEADLLIMKELARRLSSKEMTKQEMYNPFKPLTREEIIEQLTIAREHADDGMVMEAHQASTNVREKYGL